MFIDYALIEVQSGKGGDGAIAFRREKYVPKGGPSGGDGGRGGNVIFQSNTNLNTLLDLKYKRKYKAGNGDNGGTSLKDGKNGNDIIIKVPVGTVIKDFESKETLFDLSKSSQKFVLAKGGKGGRGNSKFATSTNQAPRNAEPGKPSESKKVILELKLIADIGLVGFPNAGKSTLISIISSARPKIADYPFTTLEPNLGIVKYKDFNSFTVADIPGIIEGAHKGKGLGHQFLRHIERTRIILFMLDITAENYQKDFEVLYNELKEYSTKLVKKKILVSFSKADLVQKSDLEKISKFRFEKVKTKPIIFSSISGFGINELLDSFWKTLEEIYDESS
ncbi:MAG: GTPase ObgE [Ignavibacteria bacterium]|nr:GTPase ObgE [Ignavibacteria bacterium]MBT8381437.1 GTPase ObgE [Ignavibacteria bacterium]MBT8392701.1 GTPase ObgE [Ignavibacteria bacterium]NNJ52519.1 GTPase ObgE [Ignavibacteriaceae bacterium]NNL21964.1 GTPase ObgE [Ignavibacteriaceae bacterium]